MNYEMKTKGPEAKSHTFTKNIAIIDQESFSDLDNS